MGVTLCTWFPIVTALMTLLSAAGCNMKSGETTPSEIGITPAAVAAEKPPTDRREARREASRGETAPGDVNRVEASYYGKGFEGKKTASGERFDSSKRTAAHRSLPLGTTVEVKNPDNGQKTTVEINDRGPYHGNRELDLSQQAAKDVGLKKEGTGDVEMRVVEKPEGQEARDKETAEKGKSAPRPRGHG